MIHVPIHSRTVHHSSLIQWHMEQSTSNNAFNEKDAHPVANTRLLSSAHDQSLGDDAFAESRSLLNSSTCLTSKKIASLSSICQCGTVELCFPELQFDPYGTTVNPAKTLWFKRLTGSTPNAQVSLNASEEQGQHAEIYI